MGIEQPRTRDTRLLGTSAPSYVPAIDGLRGISILLVLLYHVDESLMPGGFSGVDLFFVISGFVVSKSVDTNWARSFWSTLAHFYRRRMVRIGPALLATVLPLALLSVLFVPFAARDASADRTAVLAFLGAGNLAMWRYAGDYFAPGPSLNPFTHTWSLGVEEQFYLLVAPIAFFLFVQVGRPSRARLATGAVAAATAVSFVLAVGLSTKSPTAAFYLLPARLWELGAGVLLYIGLSRSARLVRLARGIGPRVGLVASVLLLAMAAVLTHPIGFPFPWALPAVAGAVVTITTVSLWPQSVIARLLSVRPLVVLGKLSYSLYLAHFSVVVLMRYSIGLDGIDTRVLAVVLSLLIATASYRLVEAPIRFSPGVRRRGDVTVLAVGTAVIIAAAGITAVLFQHRADLTLSRTGDRDAWAPDIVSAAEVDGCHVDFAETPFHGGYADTFTPRACEAGPWHRVFVLGDSHAWSFGKLFLTTAARLGTEVDVFNNPGCSVHRLWGSDPDLRTGPCYEFRMSALAAIAEEANPNDVLFLPALRTPRYREGSEGPFIENADLELDFVQTDRREAEASYAELEPLLAAGVRVVLEAPTPVFRAQPYRCADWFTRNNPACAAGFSVPRAELEVRRDRSLQTEQYLATLSEDVTIWDPFPLLCPGQVCESFDGDEPLYWDADHVSGYANRMLAPAFIAHLEQLDLSSSPR